MSGQVNNTLDETHIHKHWHHIMANLPALPPAVLHSGTGGPIRPDDLAPLLPMSLIAQEVTEEREVEPLKPVRDIYCQWRPSPLYRSRLLEAALDTPAHIYCKYEGVSPAGSHKPNTAVAQVFYNKEAGIKRVSTEIIRFNFSGHGHFDMQAYIDYFAGKLTDQTYNEKELAMALPDLPPVAA